MMDMMMIPKLNHGKTLPPMVSSSWLCTARIYRVHFIELLARWRSLIAQTRTAR